VTAAVLSVLRVAGIGLDTALVAPAVVAVAAFDEERAYRVCQLRAPVDLRLRERGRLETMRGSAPARETPRRVAEAV
jgi:hypothetical protein